MKKYGKVFDRLQSRRNFVERVISFFMVKSIAAIFDFNGSVRLIKDRNLYQRGDQPSKGRREEWVSLSTHCPLKYLNQIWPVSNDREHVTLTHPNKFYNYCSQSAAH